MQNTKKIKLVGFIGFVMLTVISLSGCSLSDTDNNYKHEQHLVTQQEWEKMNNAAIQEEKDKVNKNAAIKDFKNWEDAANKID